MFPAPRTPRSILAIAVVVAAMAPLVSQCKGMPIQMNLPARSTECLYEYAESDGQVEYSSVAHVALL